MNEAFRPKGGNRVHGLFDDAGAFGAVRRRKCGRNLKLPSCGRWIIAPTIITPCPADIPLSGGTYGVRHSYFLFILSYFFFPSASPVRGGGKISDFAGGVPAPHLQSSPARSAAHRTKGPFV